MSAEHEHMTNHNFKPKLDREDYVWHKRGYLPHFDGPQSTQFVTFRLCDSLPKAVVEKWCSEGSADVVIRKRIEKYLDAGYGECWLRQKQAADVVRDSIKFFDKIKYDLKAWVIMPNHVHILISLYEKVHLPEVLHSIKSFSAKEANKVLNRTGQFWQKESFDRYIRDFRHFASVVKYIENNPVKAGLCQTPEKWEYSSAYVKLDA